MTGRFHHHVYVVLLDAAVLHEPQVLAAAYFAAAWLGESLKLAVLATRVTKVAKRFFGVPDLACRQTGSHYYALPDGIRVLLSRLDIWRRRCAVTSSATKPPQLWLFGPS